jgi:DNA-binding CsgD family transcriptional regulator/PAS domain-containing protein
MEPNFSPHLVANPSESGVDTPPALVVDATDLSIVTANRAASVVFGYDPEHLVGAPIATLVVAPDELMILDHIQAVAQHNGNGNSNNGNGNGRLHAMIVHADGTVGNSRLAVTVEQSQPSVATVVVEVGTPATEPTPESPDGDGPDPGTAAWLVHQINRGVLAESEVGIALFHARTCRLVASNDAYLRLAKSQHRRLVRTLTGGIAVAVDDDDARSIHAVRRGELAVHAGPAETPDATRGRYLVCGLGIAGVAPTYFSACLYPADPASITGGPVIDLSSEPAGVGELGLLAAIVDDEWRLRLIPRYSRVLGTPKELGESVLPLIHPRDLPRLLGLGESVRSAQVGLATMSFEARGADGVWAMIDVELTRVSGSDAAPWLAILYSPLQADRGPAPAEDWEPLLLLTHPELSSREREVARALLSGYRVTTIARHLFLSPSTVRNHLSSMFHKVGVVSQAELIERFHLLRSDPFP